MKNIDTAQLEDFFVSDIRQDIDERWRRDDSQGLMPSQIASELFGMTILSMAIQPFVTPAIFSGVKKVEGLTYPDAMAKMRSIPAGSLAAQGGRTLRRRFYGSLVPAALSDSISAAFDLGAGSATAINTMFETSIAVGVAKESAERFNAANSNNFPILDKKGLGVDLTKIDYKTFCALRPNESLNINSWISLKERQKNYHANAKEQSAALLLRNGLFSSSIFLAKPWAGKIVADNEEKFKAMGIATESATEVLTHAIRASLAWLTTPIDRAFSQFSSGEKPAAEISTALFRDAKAGNFNKLFAGAVARSFLCLMTATTLAEGQRFSKFIGELMVDSGLAHFLDSRVITTSNPKNIAVTSMIDEQSANQVLKKSGLNVGKKIVQKDVESSVRAAEKSTKNLLNITQEKNQVPSSEVRNPSVNTVKPSDERCCK